MTRLLLVAAAALVVALAAGVVSGAEWDVYLERARRFRTRLMAQGLGIRSMCIPGRMSRMWMWTSGSR